MADKGHYYAWVEQNGIWYRCNDAPEDPEHPEKETAFGIMSFKEIADKFKETEDAHFVQPLSETNLLVYLEKPLHLAQLMQSSFARATLQKKQVAVARDVWQQKEAFIDQRIKNFGATIEQNLKKQWEPVFQGMLNA